MPIKHIKQQPVTWAAAAMALAGVASQGVEAYTSRDDKHAEINAKQHTEIELLKSELKDLADTVSGVKVSRRDQWVAITELKVQLARLEGAAEALASGKRGEARRTLSAEAPPPPAMVVELEPKPEPRRRASPVTRSARPKAKSKRAQLQQTISEIYGEED